MAIDIDIPGEASGIAVLLHPHPQYGGSRFHPFVDGLYRQLPTRGVGAVRFDFTTAATEGATAEVIAAIDAALAEHPGQPLVLVGYSFGAAMACMVDDARVSGWFLLALPVAMLASAGGPPVAKDPRPKSLLVPQFDQFSPPDVVRPAVAAWEATEVDVASGRDHFLGDVGPVVEKAMGWVLEAVGPE